jgi:hypothetical protein
MRSSFVYLTVIALALVERIATGEAIPLTMTLATVVCMIALVSNVTDRVRVVKM